MGARGRDGRERLRIHPRGAGRRTQTLGRPGRGIHTLRCAPSNAPSKKAHLRNSGNWQSSPLTSVPTTSHSPKTAPVPTASNPTGATPPPPARYRETGTAVSNPASTTLNAAAGVGAYGAGAYGGMNSGYGGYGGMNSGYGGGYGGMGSTYGGYGSSYGGMGGGYGGYGGMSSGYGGYGGMSSYGGMSGYGGMYGGGYGGGMYGQRGMMGMGGMMGPGMGPMGGPMDPHGPTPPPTAWQRILKSLSGVVMFAGKMSWLVDENAQAMHFFMTAMLQLLDRAGLLYGELARFVLRLLGYKVPPRPKWLPGMGPPGAMGPGGMQPGGMQPGMGGGMEGAWGDGGGD